MKTQNSSNSLRLNGHTSFEFQTRNYNTCFGHNELFRSQCVSVTMIVTETRIVITSLEFKTCMTIKS